MSVFSTTPRPMLRCLSQTAWSTRRWRPWPMGRRRGGSRSRPAAPGCCQRTTCSTRWAGGGVPVGAVGSHRPRDLGARRPRRCGVVLLVFGLVEHVVIGDSHLVQLGVPGDRAELVVAEERDDSDKVEVMIKVEDVDALLAAARKAGADVVRSRTTGITASGRAASSIPSGRRGCSHRRCATPTPPTGAGAPSFRAPHRVDRDPHRSDHRHVPTAGFSSPNV